jgi:hypothetical protein
MSTLRLKIFHRDVSDWRFQVINGRGEVLSERRLLSDRASAERIGEHERRRIAATLARRAAAARRLGAVSYLSKMRFAG